MTREEWGAIPPKKPATQLEILPAPYVVISHTVTDICLTMKECIDRVREVQNLHSVQWGWDDIGYNFLVGGDGNVYEGRGWDVIGAHAKFHNKHSIGISMIGDFRNKSPTQEQIDALKKLINLGVLEKKIASDYKLLGHRQVSDTESPGDYLFNIIQSWDHWSETH